ALLFSRYRPPRALHSFPTRRSSDLLVHHSPFQRGRDNIVSLLENIGFNHQIFTGHSLDRIATAIDQRLQIFNDRTRKCPKHGRSIKRISVKGKSPDAPSCRAAISAAVSFRWRPKWPPYNSCSERNTEDALRGEIKRALVESGITRFLPPHSCPEKLLEHFLLESANNGIFVEHVLERRVAFQNLRAAIVSHEL